MSDLEHFVLDYVEEIGGLVEPVGYGIHEMVLPDAFAERWQTQAYQQVTFQERAEADVKRLGYNHPLVEHMMESARSKPASARIFINGLRLDKSGLETLIAEEWIVLNARVKSGKSSTPSRMRSSYVLFSFKVSIISHEKQERVTSLLMDAHSGRAVSGHDAGTILQYATHFEPDQVLCTIKDAPVVWRPSGRAPLTPPLAQDSLEALLTQAKTAVLHELGTPLKILRGRVRRFKELDEARLTEYYAELERDLERRMKSALGKREETLKDKLHAVQKEREIKLADVAERYQIRLHLTLLNLLVIQQPKLVLPITIENRTTKTSVNAVYDPLLHKLEPLVCRICNQAAEKSYLCHNGHIAHWECLAPQCIDCKRVFCKQCAQELGECDVCHEALCRHSRILCKSCGRYTCREHRNLCHANDGKPMDLVTLEASEPAPEPEPEPERTKPAPKPGKRPPRSRQPAPRQTTPPRGPALPRGVPAPRQIDVIIYPDRVIAYAIASRERLVAERSWKLDPSQGVLCHCECEKGEACQFDGLIYRPTMAAFIEQPLLKEITAFREEYRVKSKKMAFFRAASFAAKPIPTPVFRLHGLWEDEAALEAARKAFDLL